MKSIRIIAVPYHLAQLRIGMGRGPEAFLSAGVAELLRMAGHEVQVEIVLLENKSNDEKKFLLALHQRIADQVREAVASEQFPLILSGNCNASIGALAALPTEELGLLWFDAHGDFNTPVTSPSGFFDGMALAVIAGLCYEEFPKNLGGGLPLSASRIAHFGWRELDPGERDNLHNCHMPVISYEQIQRQGLDAAVKELPMKLDKRIRAVHLHLDLDVLNSTHFPVNEYPAPGGLLPHELEEAIKVIARLYKISSATFSAYNPAYDPAGKTLAAGLRMIQAVAENSD